MKKILFLALALCGSVTFSQESRFSFGVKAGSNISNINDTSQTKYKVGFVGGVFANYKILHLLAYSPKYYTLCWAINLKLQEIMEELL